MSDDRRAVLEALAFGDDPKLTPSDRLRGLELLREHEPGDELRHQPPLAQGLAQRPSRPHG